MEEFLREYYSLLTHGVEFMAAVTGLFLLSKYKHTAVKYFIYFLVYVVFVELIGSYPIYLVNFDFLSEIKEIVNSTVFKYNYWWYNIFWTLGSMFFYSFYYHKILENKVFKRILKYATFLALVISLILIFSDLDAFFARTNIIISLSGTIIVLLCVLFYFIEMLNSDKILTFHRSFNFYVSATNLIWWLATVPLTFYGMYNITEDMDFVFLKWKIMLGSNIFMYSTFTFALIWCRPRQDK